MATLTLDDLSIGYGYPPVLEEINGQLRTGEWVHIHGSNGVGKSTLLKVLATLKKPLSGELRWNDESLTGLLRDSYRKKVRYFGHERALFQDLTVNDNRELYSSLFDMTGASDARLAGDVSGYRTTGRLSQGEKQRVELSTLWPSDATIVLMDEPFASLDETSRDTLTTFLRETAGQGSLIITAAPHELDGPDRQWSLSENGVRIST